MADQFGHPHAAASDAIEDRLRELARETEPLVVLAGAESARSRGERRRARRRTGAVGLVAALALGAGCWQLLPRLDTGAQRTTLPAATLTPAPARVDLTGQLTRALLPVTALPGYPKYPWKVVASSALANLPEDTCTVPRSPDLRAQAVRAFYDERDGLGAQYHLYAFTTAGTAEREIITLSAQVTRRKRTCPLIISTGGSSRSPGGATYTFRAADKATTLSINREGAYVAVLYLSHIKDTATGPGVPPVDSWQATDSWPEACIARSLKRLVSLTTGTPTPNVPSTTVPTAGALPSPPGSGYGYLTPTPPFDPPQSENRC